MKKQKIQPGIFLIVLTLAESNSSKCHKYPTYWSRVPLVRESFEDKILLLEHFIPGHKSASLKVTSCVPTTEGGWEESCQEPKRAKCRSADNKGRGLDHKNRDTHLSSCTLKSSQSAHLNTTCLSHACGLLTELKAED